MVALRCGGTGAKGAEIDAEPPDRGFGGVRLIERSTRRFRVVSTHLGVRISSFASLRTCKLRI